MRTGRIRARLFALVIPVLLTLAGPAVRAAPAVDVAPDPVLEARVRSLSEELRCLVCQNQTIADSNAGLAVDLRNQVRAQLRAGRSDAEVIDYMTARYGDFVRYRPPWRAGTALLWAGPAALMLLGGWAWWRALARPPVEAPSLDAHDAQQADALLADATPSGPGATTGEAAGTLHRHGG